MTNSEKRQRQKENSRRAREERERREQAARRKRLAIRVGVASVVVVGVVALFQVLRDDDDSAETTATTDPVDATDPTDPAAAVEYPEGCSEEEPETAAGDRPTFDAPPESTIDPETTYTARIVTTCGEIVAELDATAAPVGVNNFVALARAGFYDGLTWHRAVTDSVIQGGDPAGDGTGGPGYQVETEAPQGGYEQGGLAYAKAPNDPSGTAGSQFFVVTGNPAGLGTDGQYGSFGRVTAGLDVAQAIESLAPETGDGAPQLPVWIERIEIEEGS